MAKKKSQATPARKPENGKAKKQPKKYRYDPSLDPALSWDISADRERGEALIARIEQATDLAEARSAAAEPKRTSRPVPRWAGTAEGAELVEPGHETAQRRDEAGGGGEDAGN